MKTYSSAIQVAQRLAMGVASIVQAIVKRETTACQLLVIVLLAKSLAEALSRLVPVSSCVALENKSSLTVACSSPDLAKWLVSSDVGFLW